MTKFDDRSVLLHRLVLSPDFYLALSSKWILELLNIIKRRIIKPSFAKQNNFIWHPNFPSSQLECMCKKRSQSRRSFSSWTQLSEIDPFLVSDLTFCRWKFSHLNVFWSATCYGFNWETCRANILQLCDYCNTFVDACACRHALECLV